MKQFEIKMQHDEDTLVSLAHMQYDLFCTGNRVVRSIIAVIFIYIGVVNYIKWWGILVIAYGCYLLTSTYSSSNHTAHKIAKTIKDSGMPFPCSRYVFESSAMRVISLPDGEELEPLPYSDVRKLGMDFKYYYIFRDEKGGYMIPREALGENEKSFRSFVEDKVGQLFVTRRAPLRRIQSWLRKRENEPEHL